MARTLTFLSHAYEDKDLAEKIGMKLQNHFDVFIAHRDIEPSSEWEIVLQKRIEECDLFLALLSTKFRNANYTNQEVGIAAYLKKKIFPLSIDGTMPYGFISKYQSANFNVQRIDEETDRLSELLQRVVNETLRKIDEIIIALRYADSFGEANELAREMYTNEDFTDYQLKELANAYKSNYQIRGSWTAGPFIRKLLEKTNYLNHWTAQK